MITIEAAITSRPEPYKSLISWFGWLILGFLGGIALMTYFHSTFVYSPSDDFGLFHIVDALTSWPFLPILVLGAILVIAGKIDALRKNRDLDERTQRWSRMWRCSRCGESFEVTP